MLASCGMLAVSALMNFRFGLTLGQAPLDQYAYAGASLSGDVLKTLAPFWMAWAWANRRFLTASCAALIFTVTLAYSVTSALGFAAQNRTAVSGERQAEITTYADLTAARDRKQDQLDALPATSPVDVLQAELRAAEQHKRWTSTSACTDATVPKSRAFCKAYFATVAQLETARQRATLGTTLDDLNARVAAAATATAVSGTADPQLSTLNALIGMLIPNLPTETTKLAMTFLVMAFVELSASLGLFLSVRHLSKPTADPQPDAPKPPQEPVLLELPPDPIKLLKPQETAGGATFDPFNVEDGVGAPSSQKLGSNVAATAARGIHSIQYYLTSRVVQSKGSRIPLTDLHADYKAWARERHAKIEQQPDFEQTLRKGKMRVRKARMGPMTVWDVAFKDE